MGKITPDDLGPLPVENLRDILLERARRESYDVMMFFRKRHGLTKSEATMVAAEWISLELTACVRVERREAK